MRLLDERGAIRRLFRLISNGLSIALHEGYGPKAGPMQIPSAALLWKGRRFAIESLAQQWAYLGNLV